MIKKEELERMNYILGKEKSNRNFTYEEIEYIKQINLRTNELLYPCKIVWANKDNKEFLSEGIKQIENIQKPEVMVFESEEFGSLRGLEINGEPHFVAKDACDILELKNSRQALTRLDEDEKAKVILNDGRQNRNMWVVNEYGLYNLILASRKKEAKKFKRWVTHEILPSIRKHGGYIVGQEQMTAEELMARAVLMANNKINELNKKNKELQIENSRLEVECESMKPKADYFDTLVCKNLLFNFRETAKALHIKETNFINFLIANKYIYRNKHGKLLPYANKKCKELFEVKESIDDATGSIGLQTFITSKGRVAFSELCVGL